MVKKTVSKKGAKVPTYFHVFHERGKSRLSHTIRLLGPVSPLAGGGGGGGRKRAFV